MKKFKTLLLILICAAVVGACSSDDPPTATPVNTPAATATSEPQEAPESPLDAPESPLAEPAAVVPDSPLAEPATDTSSEPETSATSGAVIGTVLISSDKYPMLPVSGVRVALAEVVQPDSGPPRATGYDPINSPFAMSDTKGHFAIGDVKPGLYGIILDGTVTAVMLSDPDSGESIIVEIKADEVADIGTLQYENLPIPGYN